MKKAEGDYHEAVQVRDIGWKNPHSYEADIKKTAFFFNLFFLRSGISKYSYNVCLSRIGEAEIEECEM